MEVSGQLHAPATSHPGERYPGTHWLGGWVGPRTGLEAVVNIRNLCPCWELKPAEQPEA